MEQTGLQTIGAKFFNNQLGISSGPIDLRSWIVDRERSTSSGLIEYSSGICVTGIGVNSKGVISLATLQNDSLIAFARSVSLKMVPFTVMLVKVAGLDKPDKSLILFHHFFGLVSRIWLTLAL